MARVGPQGHRKKKIYLRWNLKAYSNSTLYMRCDIQSDFFEEYLRKRMKVLIC